MLDKKTWTLIAHGGAKYIPFYKKKENQEGLRIAIQLGCTILEDGGTALDAVTEVVKSLEADATFNAGIYGSVTNEDGDIEMDASIMDGETLDIGAFAGVRDIEHPVLLAKALLRDKAIFLVGGGVVKFARERNLPSVAQPEVIKASEDYDTVGCVARDKKGNFAVATSTGGLKGSRAGRVGDVPLPGCGFYADNIRGAISCSGEGESIARVLLASEFLHLLKTMPADEAAESAIKLLDRVKGKGGLIAITLDGTIAWAHNSPDFAVGMACEESPEPKVFLKKGADYV
jgi:L-asparaginase / beta-aspartyl-peptidase